MLSLPRTLQLAAATALVAATTAVPATAAAPAAGTASAATTAIRDVYKTVLSAEYFGPVSAVCGNLTAAGAKSFTAGTRGQTCTQAYDALHHTLHHKIKGADDTGYTPTAYKRVVATFMANLTITVHGTRASVHAQSGLGPSTLIEAGGHWRFNAYPPTVES
jgi:hypothetical protein